MITLNLKAKDSREQTVLDNLIPMLTESLAEKINNGVYIEKDGKRLLNKKDLTTFMQYAMEEAKKQLAENQRKGAQAVCVYGDDIMNWAMHFFEEDSIEGKLYNEDGTEYKSPKPENKANPSSSAVSYTAPAPEPKPQLNFFDMLSDSSKTKTETKPESEIHKILNPEPKKGSPMYQHYLSVKQKYNDCIVFYRLGDFYEMFGDDAKTAADVLNLTLTGRDCGLDERVPMAGIPYHAVDNYITKLVSADYKVAVIDKLDNERAVERVFTKQPEDDRLVDLETGEILSDEIEELSVEEMRQFDGYIDDPEEVPTVSKLIGEMPDDETAKISTAQTETDDGFYIEQERQKMKAFNLEAMIILQELFNSKITIV